MTRIEKKEILSDEKTKKVAMQVSTVSIVVNLLLSVFKLLAGIIGKSGAMVSRRTAIIAGPTGGVAPLNRHRAHGLRGGEQ